MARLEEEGAPQVLLCVRQASALREPSNVPAPGEMLLYPGRYSETEILFPYGGTSFARIVGQLAGCTVHSVRADLEERSTGYFAGQRPPGR